MQKKRPVLITVIAFVQIIPILLLPPEILRSVNRLLLLIPVGIFAALCWALVTLRPMGRILIIFVQGFNIIVRMLITLARVVPAKTVGTPADIPLLVTSLLSIVLSTLILYYVDKPDTQLLFEA